MLSERMLKTCLFSEVPKMEQAATWVDSALVVRVKFLEWTREASLPWKSYGKKRGGGGAVCVAGTMPL